MNSSDPVRLRKWVLGEADSMEDLQPRAGEMRSAWTLSDLPNQSWRLELLAIS